MIIKSLSRKSGSVSGLMDYMYHKNDKTKNQLQYQTRDEQLQDVSIKHLLKGHHINDWIKEFEENQQARKFKRKDMVLFYHEVVSFSPKDTELISDTMLKDIARKYMHVRSTYAPGVSTIHHDANHLHIHFCIASCNYKTGRANRLSKNEFALMKQEMETYQLRKYPELTNSVVEHGKGMEPTEQIEFQDGERKLGKRATVKAEVKAIFDKSKDHNELLTFLEQSGMPTYTRGGKTYGVTVEGRNYRFKTLGLSEQFEEFTFEQDQMDSILALQNDTPQIELLPELQAEESILINDDQATFEESLEPLDTIVAESNESVNTETVTGELESFSASTDDSTNQFEPLPVIDVEVMAETPETSMGGGEGTSLGGDLLVGGILFFLPEPPGSIDEGGIAEKKYNNRGKASPKLEQEEDILDKENTHSKKRIEEVNKTNNLEEESLLAELDAISDQQNQELENDNDINVEVEYEEPDFFVDDYTYVDFEEVDEDAEEGDDDEGDEADTG